MEELLSRNNERVKRYCKLAESKKYRAETSCFSLETVKLILEAFESGIIFDTLFVTRQCLEKHEEILRDLLQNSNTFLVSKEVSAKLSGQSTHQGIFSICKKLDKVPHADTIDIAGKNIFLVDLQDAGNVGTIIRTAEALGINHVFLTENTCDPYNPKVLRGSMGSVFRIPFTVTEDMFALMDRLDQQEIVTYASIVGKAPLAGEMQFAENAVLLIGNEGSGLAKSLIDRCQERVTVPMRGRAESLNASAAACILLWEMTRRYNI